MSFYLEAPRHRFLWHVWRFLDARAARSSPHLPPPPVERFVGGPRITIRFEDETAPTLDEVMHGRRRAA